MKLSEVVKIWRKLEILHPEQFKTLLISDLAEVVDDVVGVKCDLTEEQIEHLEDEDDLKMIEERKDEPRIPWDEAKKQLGLD